MNLTELINAFDNCKRTATESGAHESYKAVGEAFVCLATAIKELQDENIRLERERDHAQEHVDLYKEAADTMAAKHKVERDNLRFALKTISNIAFDTLANKQPFEYYQGLRLIMSNAILAINKE